MAKRLIYMNHHLKDPANRLRKRPRPVISVQSGARTRHVHRAAQGILIATVAWSPQGNPDVRTHHVAAWIEIQPSALIVFQRKSKDARRSA